MYSTNLFSSFTHPAYWTRLNSRMRFYPSLHSSLGRSWSRAAKGWSVVGFLIVLAGSGLLISWVSPTALHMGIALPWGKAAPAGTSMIAQQALGAGRLQEAQDEFLRMLERDSADQEAMRGLVEIRRRMAHDDPAMLRRQASTYRIAITQRTETAEHYNISAMEFLVAAISHAVSEVEAEGPRHSAALLPRVGAETAVSPDHTTVSAPQTTPPVSIPAAISAPRASRAGDTFHTASAATYLVKVGPISESNAAEIMRQLGVAHFSSRREDGQTEPLRLRVVSGPMLRGDARRLGSTLAQQGFPSLVQTLPDDQVELQFGVFSTQRYAEDLANQIRARGYTPAAVSEGAVRIITAGPYSGASVRAIVKIIESAMSYHSMTTVPCGSKDPLTHAWRGWVQLCRVFSDGRK